MGKKHRVACLYLFGSAFAKRLSSGNEAKINALAEACYRFTPQLAVRKYNPGSLNSLDGQSRFSNNDGDSDGAIFLEIGGCEQIYSEQLLQMKLTTLAKRFSFLSKITFADSAGEAFALAQNSSYLHFQDLPLDALIDFNTPFGVDLDIEKKLTPVIHTLKVLGLKNIGEFISLPPRTLSSRFGKEAVELSARIRCQLENPWPGFHPSVQIEEKSSVENSENLEALSFVLKILIDRVVARLHGRCERASSIQISFDLVQWGRSQTSSSQAVSNQIVKSSLREFQIDLPIAQGSLKGLLPIVQEHLSQKLEREPLRAPVDAIRFTVLESVPSRGSQRDFFTRKEEESELWDGLVARLALKLGVGKVFTALPLKRYLPERAYAKSVKKMPDIDYKSPEWPPRPTRLLKTPQALQKIDSYLIHPLTQTKWKVSEMEGPERLSGEWWQSHYEGFFRDYYRVKTITGEKLWVFINQKSPTPVFYLHGYFD